MNFCLEDLEKDMILGTPTQELSALTEKLTKDLNSNTDKKN